MYLIHQLYFIYLVSSEYSYRILYMIYIVTEGETLCKVFKCIMHSKRHHIYSQIKYIQIYVCACGALYSK